MNYDLTKLTPDIRYLDDMREVLYDKDFAKNSPNIELYYIYRGMEKNNDIRYDITTIPAKMLGKEFNKTKGHYHIGAYQEIYTILEGNAIYLIQKLDENGNISDVYAVKAEKGDFIIIPPKYGHVTINPSETQELKLANWISDNCRSDYSLFVKMQGACYFYVKNGPASAKGFGEARWVKNENYKSVPELHFEESLKSIPQNLDFLKQG